MKYKQTAYVEFSVGSKEFDAEDFFKTFLIAPTKVWKNRREEKIFEYRIDAKDALESLDEALDELRLIFSSKATEIKSYALQHDLYIKINVVVMDSKKEQCSGVGLNHKFIEFLNDLGAEIEMVVYN